MSSVYRLIDPPTGAVFYVGATSRSLKQRLAGHRLDAARYSTPANLYIRQMLAAKTEPVIEEIAQFESADGAAKAEPGFIAAALAAGHRLVNQQTGGRSGYRQAEESKRKMSVGMSASMTKDRRQKISRQHCKRRVIDVETGTVYRSTKHAADAFGLRQGNVWRCCNGDVRQTGGRRFRFVQLTEMAA